MSETEIQFIEPDIDPVADDTGDPDFDDIIEGEAEGIPTASIYGSEVDGIPEPH